MKRINIYLLFILGLLVTSCENEEINFEAPVTIKINTATVVGGFADGAALQSVKTPYVIRTSVYLYDRIKDELLDSLISYSNTYNQTIEYTPKSLEKDKRYNLVVFTWVEKKKGLNDHEDIYWTIKGSNSYKGGWVIYNKELMSDEYAILGAAYHSFNMDKPQNITLDVKPYGSLVSVKMYDIKRYSDVKTYYLTSDYQNSNVFFGNIDNLSFYKPETDILFPVSRVNTTQKESNYQSYAFFIPVKGVEMKFVARLNDETLYQLGKEMTVDFFPGQQHNFTLRLNDKTNNPDGEIVVEHTTGSKGRSVDTQICAPTPEGAEVAAKCEKISFSEILGTLQ